MTPKIIMMGLAMITGLPHAAHARSGKEDLAKAYSSWNTPYMPHYGIEGAAHPLMDHVSVPPPYPGRSTRNAWRLDFAPPVAVLATDDPLSAKDKRVGFRLKLDF